MEKIRFVSIVLVFRKSILMIYSPTPLESIVLDLKRSVNNKYIFYNLN